MPSPSWISATAAPRAALRALARTSDREEADRARAILLSLEGWTSERIAAAFGVRPALRQKLWGGDEVCCTIVVGNKQWSGPDDANR